MTELLLVERDQSVLLLTLNDPAAGNALSVALASRLTAELSAAQEDPSVRVVLLQARGQIFCSGLDLREAGQPRYPEAFASISALFEAMRAFPKPILVAAQGPVLGLGMGLLLHAPLAIAAQGASFGVTDIRLGAWPVAIYDVLVDSVGKRRARELSLTGRVFGTPEAVQLGLVHAVAPAFELEDRALEMAGQLAQQSPAAIRFLNGREAADPLLIFRSPDFQEGVQAMRENRKPRWS